MVSETKDNIIVFVVALIIVIGFMFINSVQAQSIMDIECGVASTTDCVYFHHLYTGSDDILANQNPFYFLLTLIIMLLPSFLIFLIIIGVLKFLTFLWMWRKL